MDKLLELSNPKYAHLKSTFEIFDKRINSRKYIPYIERNVSQLNRMKTIRNRVLNLIKSHKLYNELEFSFKEKSDPIYGEIPDETLKLLANLSKPRMRDLKFTLIKINQMIRTLTEDLYFKENHLKFKRFNELLEYRKNICCMISNYKLTSDPMCYRFAPCKKKYINIWEIPNGKRANSRILKFDFDEATNQLACPRHHYIQCTLIFFYNLHYNYMKKLNENSLWNQNEINHFNSAIENISQRIKLLQKLARNNEFEEISSITDNIYKILQKTKAKHDEKFVSFTNSLELPSKRRLYSAYEFYSCYLNNLNKLEKIKKPETNEGTIIRTIPHIQRVHRNILFTKNLLKDLSNDKNDVEKVEQRKILNNIYDKSGRINQYIFDEKTNQISSPKLVYLENALEMQQKNMKRYEYDMRNIDNELTTKTNQFDKKRRNKSLGYADLLKRVNRLRDLVSQKKKLIEYLQNSPSKPGFPTNFCHHKVCLTGKCEEPIYKKYKMNSPYVSIETSTPSEKRLQNSLYLYEKWMQEKRIDIRYQKNIALILLNDQMEEDFPCQDVQISQHTRKMIENKIKIEMQLDMIKLSIKNSDSHFQAHKKLDSASEHISKINNTGVDFTRIFSLALPKKSLLLCSLLQYSHLMSENKRNHIACKLFKEFSKPEQIENKLRQCIPKKRGHLIPKSNDHVKVSQLFDKIIKENLIPFEKLIQFSVFKALTFQNL